MHRLLKIVLAASGVIFLATAYPLFWLIRTEPAISMMLSLYVTLGIFLLLAIRNPGAHRSLISFAAWSSVAHAGVMGYQGLRGYVERSEMIGVAVLAAIGVALLVLGPRATEQA